MPEAVLAARVLWLNRVPPPGSQVGVPRPVFQDVTSSGDTVFAEVIKLRRSHWGGPGSNVSTLLAERGSLGADRPTGREPRGGQSRQRRVML